jgi:hypothetical protein
MQLWIRIISPPPYFAGTISIDLMMRRRPVLRSPSVLYFNSNQVIEKKKKKRLVD